jgi:ribA/ribD-fused uncharacterized protein
VIELRVPVLGDKFSSRHGQKGTIGMFVSSADMHRTADGLVPDVMVNPGGLISRMTVAQLVEMVAGRAGAALAAKFNATTFCNNGDFVGQIGEVLHAIGAHRSGDNVLYSGITGEQIRTDIFMCPLYFMRLKHLTEDKVNARGAGRREVRTHQPTGGRANEGGLRIGEMERDSLCSHGVSTFLQESMMRRGDETQFWVCNGCGRIPIYNEPEGLFVCPTCDGPLTFNGVTRETLTLQLPTRQSRVSFSRVAMPYTLKLLDQEMSGIGGFGMRLVTEGRIGTLREDEWAWPAVDVEFKVGERDVGATEAVNPDEMAAAEEALAAAKEKPRRKETGVAGLAPSGKKVADEAAVASVVGVAASATASGPGAAMGGAAMGGAAMGGAGGVGGAGAAVSFDERTVGRDLLLSTFAPTPFQITGKQLAGAGGVRYPDFAADEPGRRVWPTVEHYYQAMKFPNDPMWQEEIRRARTPAIAKRMGLSPDHPVRPDWEAVKVAYMRLALEAKFRQNGGALAVLLDTMGRPIEYTTRGDTFWGMGARRNGQNRLGQLLMEVRQKLSGVSVADLLMKEGGGRISATAAAQPGFVEAVMRARGLPELEEEAGNSEFYDQPANMASAAADVVSAATAGQIQLAAAGGADETVSVTAASATTEGGAAGVQRGGSVATGGGQAPNGGGVYLFVNPVMAGQADMKARRARAGGAGRAFTWDGAPGPMGGEGNGGQMGGGAPAADLSSVESTAGAEVLVMKEGQ